MASGWALLLNAALPTSVHSWDVVKFRENALLHTTERTLRP